MSNDKRCLVAVCHNGPVVFTKTTRSLMELGWGNRVDEAKRLNGFSEISLHWDGSFPRVDALRDSSIALARQDHFTHVLFLDADMVWPSDVLLTMLRHAAEPRLIASGLYVTKAEPFAPVAMGDRFQKEGSQVNQFHHANEYGTELVDVDVVGMGCCLIPLDVFDAIGPRPWFEYQNDDHGWPLVTEDVPFCLKAKEAGYRVALDPTVKCGHAHVQIVDERWHRRYQESMAETTKRMPVTLQEVGPGAPR